MRYRELAPSAELAPYIHSFWEFLVQPDEAPAEHEIFPDGCASVFYFRNERYNVHTVGVMGILPESITKKVSPGDVIWGMRVSPASCSSVFGRSALELVSNSFDALSFPHLLDGMAPALSPAGSLEEAINVFAEPLLRTAGLKCDEMVYEAVRQIDEAGGEIRVADIADSLNISARQMERRFLRASGLSPKSFIRTRRIRAAAIHMAHYASESMAGTAAHLGYADQSHLARDLASLTKRAPSSFASNIRRIEHKKLVK